MFEILKPFTQTRFSDLSQFWPSKWPIWVVHYHKFGVLSTKTRVEPHVDPCRVTLDTQYDQITIPWQPQIHFSENIHPMVKIRGSNHGFYYPDVVLSTKNCEIGYFYIRNSNFGDVSTICVSLSHHFVAGRLVRFLVQSPVICSPDHYRSQNWPRGLQSTFWAFLRTYLPPRIAWTHQNQNIHPRYV